MLNEVDYRYILRDCGAKLVDDKYSATTLDIAGLINAMDEMKKRGFVPLSRGARSARNNTWRKPRIDKITALWCRLADAGVIHNRSDAGMQRYCMRITKKSKLEWASSDDLNACIESLKSMAHRERVKLDG